MSDTFCDATGEYVNENSGSSTAVVSSTGEVLENGAILTDLIKLNYDFKDTPFNPESKSYNIYIWNNYTEGEIRFYTKDAKNNNDFNKNFFSGNYSEPRLNFNTKIGKNGKLYFWHNYTLPNPAKLSGWYEIADNISSMETQLIFLDGLTAGFSASLILTNNNLGIIAGRVSVVEEAIVAIATDLNMIGDDVIGLRRSTQSIWDYMDFNNNPTIQNKLSGYMEAIQPYNLTQGLFDEANQLLRIQASSALSAYRINLANNFGNVIAGVAFAGAVVGGIKYIADTQQKDNYSTELIRITDTLAKRPISSVNNTLIHTGITIFSGANNFPLTNTEFRITIQKEAVLIIGIDIAGIANILLVDQIGEQPFSVNENISINRTLLNGSAGYLVLTVSSLGTLKQWTELKATYLQNKISNVDTKTRRKANVIGADDIDTTQFTTTNVSYTDTDVNSETITYKQLKSRLNLLPTGTSDVNVYTMGNIGIGTTGSVSTNKLDILGSTKFMGMMGIGASPPLVGDAFVPLLKIYSDLETTLYIRGANTTGSASIEFSLGERLDPTADFRLTNLGGGDGLYLQYQDETLAYNASGSDLVCFKPALTNFYKDVNINVKCGIGTTATAGVILHAYDADDCVIRLSTGTGSTDKTQIQFIRGTITDTNTDYRLISDLTIFKLQYATNTIAFGAASNASDLMAWRSTGTTIYKNTTMSASCAIGGASIDATSKLNVGGDVNISAGSSYKIDGTAIPAFQLTAGTGITITNGAIYADTQLTAGTGITITSGTISANTQLTAGSGITITSGTISANTQLTAGARININNGVISAFTGGTRSADTITGTLAIANGGTGANDIGAGAIPFGSTLEDKYNWTADLRYDSTNKRLGLGILTPLYTLDCDGNINIPTGSTYKINGADLSYTNLTNQLTAGNNITITSGAINATVPAQLTAGNNITITSGAINATVPAQLTAGTGITITSGAINADTQLTAGTNITISSGVINAVVPAFNLFPTGVGDIDIYTLTGKIGIGTATPATQLHINDTTDAIARISTGTSGKTQLQFVRGTTNDTNTDFRFICESAGSFKLQHQNNIFAWGGIGSDVCAFSGTQISFYKLTTFLNEVGIGGVFPAYPLDVGGDVNISAGSVYRIGGTALSYTNLTNQLTAGTNISITGGVIDANVPTTFSATAITSGTLALARGGTGTTTIGNGTLVFGNSLQTGYTWNNVLKWDNTNSRLGVGITTPLYTLDVLGTSRFSSQITATSIIQHQTNLWNKSSDGGNRYYFEVLGASFYSGGTSGSANARMHEWRRTYDAATLGYFENTGLFRSWGYLSLSDERIKKNIRDIDDNEALDKILLIQPKKYNYIEIEKSKNDVIGFIAQQIGEVIPEAITKTEGIPPNIYKYVSVKNKNEICYSLPSTVKIGTEVIITDTEEGTGDRYKIQEIYDDYFVIDKEIEGDVAFVKGYSIKDLHALNKDYIFTLNVSATQELHRKIISQEERIRQLEEKVDRLLNYLA